MVSLLKTIRDIIYNKKERNESVMTIVESNVELFTIYQAQGDRWTSITRSSKHRSIPLTRMEATPGTTP